MVARAIKEALRKPPWPPRSLDALARGSTHRGGHACHAPPAYTSRRVYDVGMPDEVGNTRFNLGAGLGVSQAQLADRDGICALASTSQLVQVR